MVEGYEAGAGHGHAVPECVSDAATSFPLGFVSGRHMRNYVFLPRTLTEDGSIRNTFSGIACPRPAQLVGYRPLRDIVIL